MLQSNAGGGERVQIRVGVYENEPKIFTDDNGKWVGFWPDITEYIANQENWEIKYVEGTWSECLTRLENNEIDMLVDMGYSNERNLTYDFNNVPVFENWGVIFAREYGTILSFSDLEGKVVAVMNNSIHTTGEFGIKNITSNFGINCTFLNYSDYYQVFESLDNGTADAGVVNRLFGLSNRDDYDVVQTSLIFNNVELKFAFPKNATLNENLIARIDHHLVELQDDPNSIYYASIEQYFHQIAVKETIPEWLIYAIIMTAILVIVFLFMSLFLKRIVNERTRSLRESNSELGLLNQILIQTMPNGFIFVDCEGNISIINQNFKNMYFKNYSKEIKSGMNIKNLPGNVLINSIKKEVLKTDIEGLSPKESEIRKQAVSLETSAHLELYYSKMFSKQLSGGFGHLFVTNDVTSYKILENIRRQFISMLSHELRNPITAIKLSLVNLIKYQDKLDKKQQMDILKMMQESGEILSTLTEDLLTLSTMEERALELSIKEFNLNKMIAKIQDELNFYFIEKNIKLSADIPPNIKISGDPRRLHQIIRILIDNAIKYSPADSEIKVQAVNNYVDPNNLDAAPGVLVKITDNGIGIPKKDLPNVFKKFSRGSNVAGIKGSGLGLNIAKTLVELHNGTISVTSEEGKGSTFSIFIPN
ncbi:MAG: ATP-binding protein [Candidatus Hodarchaeota archaeon]